MFENQEHIDLALNNLEHAGVKGMKWGVRKLQAGTKKIQDYKASPKGVAKREKKERLVKNELAFRKLSRKEKNQAIKEARANQARKELDVYKSLFTGDFKGAKVKAKDLLTGDNVRIAIKTTTGERIARDLLAVGALAVALAPRTR